MKRRRVSIVGAGNVGATLAHLLVQTDLADVALMDIVPGVAAGKALDLTQSTALLGSTVHVQGGEDFTLLAGSDVVVITAGAPRTPGMSRDDLLLTNATVVRQTVMRIRAHAPEAIVLVITNPVDALTYLVQRLLGVGPGRVFGMAGELDGARFAYAISNALGIAVGDVRTLVLGGHGDSMVPLARLATVEGTPLAQRAPASLIHQLIERTRNGGAEIVALLGKGSAYYAPAAAAAKMIRAVFTEAHDPLTAVALLQGEYGEQDVCLGVPVLLGRTGVARIIELDLTEEERKALHASAASVRQQLAVLRTRNMFSQEANNTP